MRPPKSIREKLVSRATLLAHQCPPMTGENVREDEAIRAQCTHVVSSPRGLRVLIFTRDEGAFRAAGERCFHLSVSFRSHDAETPLPHDFKESRKWCEAFFGSVGRLWAVPPESPEGKRWSVFHFADFVADDWKTPLTVEGDPNWRRWAWIDRMFDG